MKKIGIAILSLAALVLAGNFALRMSKKEDKQPYQVKRGELISVVEATGTLESTNSAHVTCPRVTGQWRFTVTFLAPEGQLVKKGMPIIRFDDKDLREKLMLKQARLASERKKLEKIKLAENETLEQLVLDDEGNTVTVARAWRMADVPQHLHSGLETSQNRLDHQLAQARKEMTDTKVRVQEERMKSRITTQQRLIVRLEQEVTTLSTSIASMTLKAPKNGLVVYADEGRGDKISVGDTVWLGKTLMELPDLTHMRVKATIDESDAGRVALDQTVEVRLDADPAQLYLGKVKQLGRIFHKKSRQKPATVFDAMVLLEQSDQEIMRPGMAAKIRILVERAEGVLILPEHAISYEGDQPHVVLQGVFGKESKQLVRLGRRAGGFVEVLQGLKQGQTVMLHNRGTTS